MAEYLLFVPALCAGMSWCYAALQFLISLGHLRSDLTLRDMARKGHLAFDPASYDDQGKAYQRGFVQGFIGFFVSILALIAVALTVA